MPPLTNSPNSISLAFLVEKIVKKALQPYPIEESILNRDIIGNDLLLSREALQDDINFIKNKVIEDHSQKNSNAAPANFINTSNKITLETVSQTLYRLVINEQHIPSPEILSNALWCIESAQNFLNEEDIKNAQEFTAYAFQFFAPIRNKKYPKAEVKTDPFLRKFAEVIFILSYTAWSLFKDRSTSNEYFETYAETHEHHKKDTDRKLSEKIKIKYIQAITGTTFQPEEGIIYIAYSLIDACAFLKKKNHRDAAQTTGQLNCFLVQTLIAPFYDGSPQAKGERGAQARKKTLDAIKEELKVKVLSVMQAPEHALKWKSKESAIEFLATQLSAHQSLKDQEKLHGQISRLFKSDVEINTLYKSLNESWNKP